MNTYFPQYFTNRAILLYSILIVLVALLFGYPMQWYAWVFGIISVVAFFYYSFALSKDWRRLEGKALERQLFMSSALLRLVYVVISFFFYKVMTGVPFKFGAADAHWYDDMGRLGADIIWGEDIKWSVFFKGAAATDLGYPVYLAIIYALTGKSILLARCVKALISSWTVVLMYKMSKRHFGASVGLMTGVFCMLMPNLVYYCGSHLKETEMLFLVVLFMERADNVFHQQRIRLQDILLLSLTVVAVYFFRGILSALLALSFAGTMVLGSTKMKRGGKWAVEGILLIVFGVAVFGNRVFETLGIGEYSSIQAQQEANIEWRAQREGGNSLAVNASSAVYAPLIFTIPFPTLVDIKYQEDQQMMNGGNFVKNITSFLTILALLMIFAKGEWHEHILLLAFTLGYLVVLIFSNFAQSERFHIPSLPFELMFASYGVALFKSKHKNLFTIWLVFILVANLGWAWFKLRGRGM